MPDGPMERQHHGRFESATATADQCRVTPEGRLLELARAGDEDAFAALARPLRNELHARCRHMLRSPHDADDALQETLLRAWRGLPGFQGRSSLRSWLYRIATTVCLSMLLARRRERAPGVHRERDASDLGDAAAASEDGRLLLEPGGAELSAVEDSRNSPVDRYERREGFEMALVAAFQHLTRKQRAALVLSEALGFTGREAAELLGTTTASINSALQRARRAVDERFPERRHQPSLRTLGDERLREVVERYVSAMEDADVPAVAMLLGSER
jgi:RNA polymerase sigma-70 factor, ECF subfamily